MWLCGYVAKWSPYASAFRFTPLHPTTFLGLYRGSIGALKKVVGCRGGNQHVEGCWCFPYLKVVKLPNLHFMFFDRYEIQIQAFLKFINGQFIIFRSSSPQTYFKNMYSILTRIIQTGTHTFEHFRFFLRPIFPIENILPGFSQIVS